MEDRPSRETGDIVANVIANTARLSKMGKRCASYMSIGQIWLVSMRDFESLERTCMTFRLSLIDMPLAIRRILSSRGIRK